MAVKRIDSIYDVQSISKEQELVVQSLTDAQKKIVDLYNTIQQYKGADFLKASEDAKKLAQALKESTKATEAAVKANQAFEKSQLALAKTREANAKATAAEIKLEKEVVNLIAAEDKAQTQLNKSKQQGAAQNTKLENQRKREQKEIEDIGNDYLQLSKAYNDAALKARNYALVLGEQHPVAQEAIKDAKQMHDTLLRVDQAVGISNRNVGNYSSAFNGLGVSISQLSRELPALAVSGQTFLLAISNNLPIFIDEVTKAKAEIAALKAQGQETTGLFSRIASSFLSFTNVLTIGIAILTIFGRQIGDFIVGLFKAEDALGEITDEQIAFNEALAEGNTRIRSFSKLLQESINNELLLLRQRADLLEATGASQADIFAAEKDYSEKRKEFIVQQLTGIKGVSTLTDEQLFKIRLLQSGSSASLAKLTKDLNGVAIQISETSDETDKKVLENRQKFLQLQFDSEKEAFQTRNQLLEDYFETNKTIVEKEKQLQDDRAKFIFERNKLILEDAIKTYQKIADNASVLPALREDAAKKVFDLQKQLIQLTADFEIETSKKTAEEIALINTRAALERKDTSSQLEVTSKNILIDRIEIERRIAEEEKKMFEDYETGIKKQQEANETYNEEAKKGAKNLIDFEIDTIKTGEQIKLTEIQIAADNKQTELNKQREAGLISEKKFAEESANIQKQAAKEALSVSIQSAEAQLTLLAKAGLAGTKAYDELRKAIAAAKKEQSSFDTTVDKSLANWEKQLRLIKDATQAFTDAINTIAGIGFDTRQAQLETQRNELEKNSEQEIENIENSTLSEEEKQIRIQKAQAITDTKKQEIERRQREIDMQRARFQKASDIANIITTTALAVVSALTQVKTLGPGAYALAAAVGALGAAQLAAAIATPLPQFKKGTDDAPEGWALTDEAGAEGYIEPSGKVFIGNNKPTLRYLRKGTKIIPHDKLNKSVGINAMLLDIAGGINKAAVQAPDYSNDNKNTDRIVRAIRATKPRTSIVKVDLGFANYIEKNVYK